ncbi:uncharacterized protein At2g29880-like [Daucus carota subsp. sativus]|nr:PREDICTED: uncharacterized protein At2g29880-like [Daucus carota subsp. sativus]
MDVERGAGRNKRKWSEEEDEKLVESLIELVNNGAYKADNGFKPGYLGFLENSLSVKLPTSGLKGKPHIESRIKTLKKDFNMVYDLRYGSTSGFGWNSENQLVTASRDVWAEYAKSHVGVLKWRSTPFPFFDDLAIIFGKDRATGHNAESAMEAEENINLEEAAQGKNDDSSMQASDESTSRRSSKRKKFDAEQMAEVMYNASKMIAAEFANSTKVMAAEFASSTKLLIAAETDRLEKKEKLMDELSKISDIDVVQRFKAAKKIADSENLMVLFFGASDAEKKQLVDAILAGEI